MGPLLCLGTQNNGRESVLSLYCLLEHSKAPNVDLIKKSTQSFKTLKDTANNEMVFSPLEQRTSREYIFSVRSPKQVTSSTSLPINHRQTYLNRQFQTIKTQITKHGPHKMQPPGQPRILLPLGGQHQTGNIPPEPETNPSNSGPAHGLGRAVPMQITVPRGFYTEDELTTQRVGYS